MDFKSLTNKFIDWFGAGDAMRIITKWFFWVAAILCWALPIAGIYLISETSDNIHGGAAVVIYIFGIAAVVIAIAVAYLTMMLYIRRNRELDGECNDCPTTPALTIMAHFLRAASEASGIQIFGYAAMVLTMGVGLALAQVVDGQGDYFFQTILFAIASAIGLIVLAWIVMMLLRVASEKLRVYARVNANVKDIDELVRYKFSQD